MSALEGCAVGLATSEPEIALVADSVRHFHTALGQAAPKKRQHALGFPLLYESLVQLLQQLLHDAAAGLKALLASQP